MSYEEIKKEIAEAPMTWLPGLLTEVVKASIRKKVFRENAVDLFVARVEREYREELRKPPQPS